MSVPTPADGTGDPDVQAAFAATLVDEWARGGVAHAVVCPGSRSTPLALALAAHPAMAVHVRLDERSAGFTALGIGRATGRPALVLTTSGTAAAELHAAVVEADLAGGAPHRLHRRPAAGAPRRGCPPDHRPGPSVRRVGALVLRSRRGRPGAARATWRSLAARSVAEAASGGGGPGPVHLNLPFREPLLGDPAGRGRSGPGTAGRATLAPGGPRAAGRPRPARCAPWSSPDGCHPAPAGLIVAGAGCGDPDAVLGLADALGLAGAGRPAVGAALPRPGVVGAADGILRSERFAARHRPETVLRLGEPWASKVVNGFVSASAAGGADVVVVDPWGRWRDPQREASTFIRSDPTLFCRGGGPAAPRPRRPTAAMSPGAGARTGWVPNQRPGP